MPAKDSVMTSPNSRVATKRDATDPQVYAALDAAVRGIAGYHTLDETLQLIVDLVRPLVAAEYVALGIVDSRGAIERFITSGMDDATRRRIGDLPRGKGLLGLIIRENRSYRIADIATDPRRAGFPPHHPEMHSFLGVPIAVEGNGIGRLYLTNKIGAPEFSPGDQQLVETFAVHAGLAMERAVLQDQVRRLAVVDERERISQDLHDGIIQDLYAVGLALEDVPDLMADNRGEASRRVERAIESLHLTIRDIRNFIFGLRPEFLEGAGLRVGLAALAEELRLNAMLEVELRAPTAVPDPTEDVAAQILAIAKEALSNVARHAGAHQVVIDLADEVVAGASGWRMTISDDGVGFDPRSSAVLGHHGLANMRARVRDLGGTLDIDSRPGGPTRVAVWVPAAELPAPVEAQRGKAT
jgi:signal transduction histidine kinase